MYIRKPAVAGQFYTADQKELATQIDNYLSMAPASAFSGIQGIVSPHAGYVFSGPVAGTAYAAVRNGTFDSVIICAPSHTFSMPGASVIGEGAYRTPLGDVSIDSKLASLLIDNKQTAFIPRVHETEHSLEVQVPFIQRILPSVPIVPLIIGTIDYEFCIELGHKIALAVESAGRKSLIVMSTDLSHYHSYDEARAMDTRFCSILESCDTEKLRDSIERKETAACGYGPLLAGITASKDLGANSCHVVDYRNSGDTAGSKSQVVGYCAAVLHRKEQ